MRIMLNVIPILAAIGLLSFIALKINDYKHKQLAVISLSVFIFTQLVMFFPDNFILWDVYGNDEQMLQLEQEGDVYYESDDVHYIDGQAYREIFIYEWHTWADVLFCLVNLFESGSICLLVWVALSVKIEDKSEIEAVDYPHY
ncbi:MAG TPA: hypothetical protein EYG51_10920 [Pseudomonadales bacterium]|nr:hypothetical protein [Pseudomonadales bacterium]